MKRLLFVPLLFLKIYKCDDTFKDEDLSPDTYKGAPKMWFHYVRSFLYCNMFKIYVQNLSSYYMFNLKEFIKFRKKKTLIL